MSEDIESNQALIEKLKSNPKFNQHLIGLLAEELASRKYPEYESLTDRVMANALKKEQEFSAKDAKLYEVTEEFTRKIRELGSMGAIKQYCILQNIEFPNPQEIRMLEQGAYELFIDEEGQKN